MHFVHARCRSLSDDIEASPRAIIYKYCNESDGEHSDDYDSIKTHIGSDAAFFGVF